MSDQKKKPIATEETIKQLEELQSKVTSVAEMATKVTQQQRTGAELDKKELRETLVQLTGLASDLASQVAKIQKDLGLNKGKPAASLSVVKSDAPKGRGPIRG